MRSSSVLAAVTAMSLTLATPARAQSLRGSQASIDRMYEHAKAEKLPFYETSGDVRSAVASGRLVSLDASGNIQLHSVAFPYVRPSTRMFVDRLSAQYVSVCREPLVVTSGVRPATRQPRNSVSLSVHPTGMAVDVRRPRNAKCLRWLRSTLAELEGQNVLEATEEHWPAHFHVAVYPTQYTRWATTKAKSETVTQVASRTASIAMTYKVHEGDTLWDIAREHHVSVDAILGANDLSDDVIHPGQELKIPTSR
jgi:LysM repeat protein